MTHQHRASTLEWIYRLSPMCPNPIFRAGANTRYNMNYDVKPCVEQLNFKYHSLSMQKSLETIHYSN